MCKVRDYLHNRRLVDFNYSAHLDKAAGERGNRLPMRFCGAMVAAVAASAQPLCQDWQP